MGVTTITFLLSFLIVAVIYYILPAMLKNVYLLIVSYIYYASWNKKYVLLLLSVTILTYCTGWLLEHFAELKRKKLGVLLCCLVLCFCCLFFFKYWNFTVESLNQLLEKVNFNWIIPQFSFLAPIGISFFTFQTVGYLIDVYRRDIAAEKNFISYALFVSFFLQILAGPINRAKSLLPQINNIRKFDWDRITDGFLSMVWGYFLKCVISDRIAILVNSVYTDYTNYAGNFYYSSGSSI